MSRGRLILTALVGLIAAHALVTLPGSALFIGLIFQASLLSAILLLKLPPRRTWYMWWVAYLPFIAFFGQTALGTFPFGALLSTLVLLYLLVIVTAFRVSTGIVWLDADVLVVEWKWLLRSKTWRIPYSDMVSLDDADLSNRQYRNLHVSLRPTVNVTTEHMTFDKKGDRCFGLNLDQRVLPDFKRELSARAPQLLSVA
jgi:hypothetical protein